MPIYKYVAVNLQKKKHRGIFIAENEKDLALQLSKQNLYLISSSVYEGGRTSVLPMLGAGKVKRSEITAFCRQFSIMISMEIPLTECLATLRQQPFSRRFRSVLHAIEEDVKGGAMLSEALDRHRKVFPDFFRSMVYVGEASGRIDRILVSLADYYESEAATARKVQNALSYPIMLAFMTLAIVILMLAFVVPTFRETLNKLGVEPQGLTLTVYRVSDFVLNWWKPIALGAVLLPILLSLLARTKFVKRASDLLQIKSPVIGRIHTNLIAARFSRALGLLLESGMDLARALDAVSAVLGNSYIRERFLEAAQNVRRGASLTNALREQNIFPGMLIQMISVGEKTASLEEVLGRSARFFEEQTESALSLVISKIQPAMLIVMGTVIGILFIAIYSPMLSIMNGLI